MFPHTQGVDLVSLRKIVADKVFRPLEVQLGHQILVILEILTGCLAKSPTRRKRFFQDCADRGVESAEEVVLVGGLDQGVEVLQLLGGLLLVGVAQQVWEDGLVVTQVVTNWHSYWLALSCAREITSLHCARDY